MHIHIYKVDGKILLEFRPKKPKDMMLLDELEKKKEHYLFTKLCLVLKRLEWIPDGQTKKPFLRLTL